MAYQSAQRNTRKRLLFLVAVMGLAVCALVIRLFALTVVQGAALAHAADDRLDVEKFLPTWRGKLLDRTGRILAQDIATYDAAVSYSFAKGQWAAESARSAAKTAAGAAWRKLSPAQRDERTTLMLPEWVSKQTDLLMILATRAGLSRGELEERLAVIVKRIDDHAAAVARGQAARQARGQSLDVKPEPIREMREMHVISQNLPTESAFDLRKISDEFPSAIEVIDATMRSDPWESAEVEVQRTQLPRPIRTSIPLVLKMDGAIDQLVGSVRNETWKEDLDRRPFERTTEDGRVEVDLGGYRAGRDAIGARGMERQFEDELRGLRGHVVHRRDSNDEERIEPVPGHDVMVSIDAQLQMRVQAALDPRTGLTIVQPWQAHSDGLRAGDALPAAAVIVDIATGEVLAAGSTPLPQDQVDASRGALGRDGGRINRALEAAYPPGSLVKPLVYLAAIAEGVAREDEQIECNGHFFKDRTDAARCWIYRDRFKMATHTKITGGPLSVEVAIARSCNIYFYTLANRLGAARLCEWYRRFGLGTMGGSVPTVAAAEHVDAHRDQFSTVSLGIGQGPLTVTPLEMANAYAMVARGGSVRSPVFLKDSSRTTAVYPFSPTAVSRVLEGLRRVVSESYGTGHHMEYGDGSHDPIIEAAGVRVWAKTGTAEAPPLKIDRDNDGVAERIVTDADHAWCAALVGNPSDGIPRYAIAVIVERGGGGGRTAGPVMGAVIRALVSEHYLGAEGSANSRNPISVGATR